MTNVLTRRGGALLERCRRWFSHYFAGAEPALCQMALAISALVAGVTLASTYWPQPWGYACLSAALLALLELGLWLARKLLKRLLDHGLGWLMALGLLLAAVSDTVKRGAGEGWTWRVWVFSALVTAALWLLAGSWWSLLRRRVVAPVTVCAGVLSLGMTALLAVFLFTDGFDDHIIRRYLDLSPNREAREEALEPSLADGPYEVLTLDYGPGEALEAGTALEDLEQLLARCVASKKSFVEEDTRDTGRRMILNFGHTFGHALEKLHNFQGLSHGEAVGIGMVLACQVGERLGVTPAGTGARVAAVLERYGLPTQDSFSWEEIVEATALDKKSDGSTLRLILLTQLGEAAIYPVTRDRLKTLL